MLEELKKIGIVARGTKDGGKYIVSIPDSDNFARYESIFEKSDVVEEKEYNLTLIDALFVYESDSYKYTMKANFLNDIYTLTCEEI